MSLVLPVADDLFLPCSRIHCRYGGMTGFIENPDAVDLISEIARTLKPGGVVLLEMLHVSWLHVIPFSDLSLTSVPNPCKIRMSPILSSPVRLAIPWLRSSTNGD